MVGFIVKCNHCSSTISSIDDVKDHQNWDQLNADLSKVTNGFFGEEVEVKDFEDMEGLSRIHLLCRNCQDENFISTIKVTWNNLKSKMTAK
ncbi:hypothetical protein [Bacillus wiedmannii]|uniref:Uncharacterized protein n=1 Tax=Bacillus wiedmannii TaxID=1890302 RepID=A0A2C4H7P7_9BACI|nr:hypothetical protein [Bacillus wiedmannii]PEJ11502.1 hypothetical protein CN684_00625 [Bacillus wiedmannii]PHC62822.1 hypothetical protein COF35_27875 [Bacillus wiedmannii]